MHVLFKLFVHYTGYLSITVELTSLLTLHGISKTDEVVALYGKLYVTQSMRDELLQMIIESEGVQSDGFMSVAKEKGTYVRDEITKEQIEKNTKFLKKTLDWVDKNCIVIPCKEVLKLPAEKRAQLYEALGISALETVLIAKQEKSLLLSEDFVLRTIAKNDFGVEGIWTQAVLMDALSKKALTKEDYDKCLIKLICSQYYYTSIDWHVLEEAARQANWSPMYPYNIVVKKLGGDDAEIESNMRIVEDLICGLLSKPILLPSFERLIQVALDAATVGRSRKQIADILLKRLKQRLRLLPLVFKYSAEIVNN